MKNRQQLIADISFREQLTYRSQLLSPEMRLERNRRKDAAKASDKGMSISDYRARYGPMWQAKKLAKRIGLAYWPALIREIMTLPRNPQTGARDRVIRDDGQGFARCPIPCNPRAFLVAERILSEKHGLYDPESGLRGGWDAEGHYGISAADVAKMWFSAGCRDTPKFRFQVTSGVVGKKGDSVAFLKAFARGKTWVTRHMQEWRVWPDRRTQAALGKMAWPCRWAALVGVQCPQGRPIRLRDLNWSAVKTVQAAWRAGDTQTLIRYVPPKAGAYLLGKVSKEDAGRPEGHWKEIIAPFLCPAYPSVSWEVAQRVSRGESPVEVSEGKLVRKEAHEWLKSGGGNSPEEWLSEKLSRETGTQFHHRSMRVLRWMERLASSKDRWEAVTREREAPGPGGVMRRFTTIQVLDEVSDDDIQTGRDSVDAVLRRVSERLGEAFLSKAAKDFRQLQAKPNWASRIGKFCKVLLTPSELVEEGKKLGHCVGGYVDMVERGQCWILSICTPNGDRSTVELSPGLTVAQHKSDRNQDPTNRHRRILDAILKRIRKD